MCSPKWTHLIPVKVCKAKKPNMSQTLIFINAGGNFLNLKFWDVWIYFQRANLRGTDNISILNKIKTAPQSTASKSVNWVQPRDKLSVNAVKWRGRRRTRHNEAPRRWAGDTLDAGRRKWGTYRSGVRVCAKRQLYSHWVLAFTRARWATELCVLGKQSASEISSRDSRTFAAAASVQLTLELGDSPNTSKGLWLDYLRVQTAARLETSITFPGTSHSVCWISRPELERDNLFVWSEWNLEKWRANELLPGITTDTQCLQ